MKTTPGKRPLKTLERVFSKAGAGSRSDARSWIGAGRVRVNGKVVLNPDHWVDLGRDRVTLDGKPLGEYPVIALETVPIAGLVGRAWDSVRLWLKK